MRCIVLVGFIGLLWLDVADGGELAWPINCVPGQTCIGSIGYPDINSTGVAFNCGPPGYLGHQGTDIISAKGTDVLAALDGEVLWAFDGKFDECPSAHPDCQPPPENWFVPGQSNGFRVCTDLGPYCGSGSGNCFWCSDGGNFVVIKHPSSEEIFATKYDHFKTNSILVSPGDTVTTGQKIGEVASAGRSTAPHVHFEVWDTGFFEVADPWAGECGPNFKNPLWEYGSTPWKTLLGNPVITTRVLLLPILMMILQD